MLIGKRIIASFLLSCHVVVGTTAVATTSVLPDDAVSDSNHHGRGQRELQPLPSLSELVVNSEEFSTLRGLILQADVLDAFDTTTQLLLTVLGPNDDAFTSLAGAAPALVSKLSTLDGWKLHLTDLLGYHVLLGNFTSSDLLGATAPLVVTAANDVSNLTIATNNNVLEITDETGGVSKVVAPFDVMASNGVIHAIDRVLLPSWTTMTIMDGGRSNLDEFSILVSLIERVGLAEFLSGYGTDSLGLTLFAPLNAAFANIDTDTLTDEQITSILSYHVSPSVVPSTLLTTGNTIPTVQGSTIAVVAADEDGSSFTVNGNPVVFSDLFYNNGIVHVIDQVLIPPTPDKCPIRSRLIRHRNMV